MTIEWLPGLPPGPYYLGMELEYEVAMTIGGAIWYRPAGPIPPTGGHHAMKTDYMIYRPDGTVLTGTCELADAPGYDAIQAIVRPLIRTLLTTHDHPEHVTVLGNDGERADMFVDDEGQKKDLDRNDKATEVYRRSWMRAYPKTDPETLPYIYGDAVLFMRRIWF